MNKIFTLGVAAMLFLGASVAQAQQGEHMKPAKERADKLTKEMTKTLSLDATQQQKVATLNLEYAQKIDSCVAKYKDQKGEREEMKTEMQQLNTQKDAQLKQVLTSDQYTKWSEKKGEAKEMMKEKGKEMKKEMRAAKKDTAGKK